MRSWRKKGKEESKPKEERTTSFRRILRSGKVCAQAAALNCAACSLSLWGSSGFYRGPILSCAQHKGEAAGSGSTGDESQKTVFISCSALLREVRSSSQNDMSSPVHRAAVAR